MSFSEIKCEKPFADVVDEVAATGIAASAFTGTALFIGGGGGGGGGLLEAEAVKKKLRIEK